MGLFVGPRCRIIRNSLLEAFCRLVEDIHTLEINTAMRKISTSGAMHFEYNSVCFEDWWGAKRMVANKSKYVGFLCWMFGDQPSCNW